ncbi:MAG: ArsR/SmtB family transcription factor [Verrucomicrobiia bacterium]|jgi:DNA-binding transcriptional ArsR family regulator
MKELLNITGALADENRLKILFALQSGELCVCQITAFLKLAPSTVSKHLSILKQAGLVDSRKTERWVYYFLPRKNVSPSIKSALDWVLKEINSSSVSPQLTGDIQKVLKLDVNDLCKTQTKNRRCSSSARVTRVAVTSPKGY